MRNQQNPEHVHELNWQKKMTVQKQLNQQEKEREEKKQISCKGSKSLCWDSKKQRLSHRNQTALQWLHCSLWQEIADNQLYMSCRTSSCRREGIVLHQEIEIMTRKPKDLKPWIIHFWRPDPQMPSHRHLLRWVGSFGPVPNPMCPPILSSSSYGRRDGPRDGSVPADGSQRGASSRRPLV